MKIKNVIRILFLCCCCLLLLSCKELKQWGQFHGDTSNHGFRLVNTSKLVSPTWTTEPLKIGTSSIVIGKDSLDLDVLYVGTKEGQLLALNSTDGSVKWKTSLETVGAMLSTPAVSVNGDIYTTTYHVPELGRPLTYLHKIDQYGNTRWTNIVLPDNAYTSSSLKIVQDGDDTLIFVYGTHSLYSELFVFRDGPNAPELLDREYLDICSTDLISSSYGPLDLLRDIMWVFENIPMEFDASGTMYPSKFLDPTLAVVKNEQGALVAVVDQQCQSGVFSWNGTNLEVIWQERHDYNDQFSSPLITSDGLMIFGKVRSMTIWSLGVIFALDIQTGKLVWSYPTRTAFITTPVAPFGDRVVYVASQDTLFALDQSDGSVIHKAPIRGNFYASPAVSANNIHVAGEKMLTINLDLSKITAGFGFEGNGLSSPAIGSDGAVYGVQRTGAVSKYTGP